MNFWDFYVTDQDPHIKIFSIFLGSLRLYEETVWTFIFSFNLGLGLDFAAL